MIRVQIDLATKEGLWEIQNIAVTFDDGRSGDLGSMGGWQSYVSSVDEAKRWALLKIRHNGCPVDEEHIRWDITPPFPSLAA